jgi:hypothetical protein
MLIFTTASEPSSFRVSETLSMISLAEGPAFASGIGAINPGARAKAANKTAVRVIPRHFTMVLLGRGLSFDGRDPRKLHRSTWPRGFLVSAVA